MQHFNLEARAQWGEEHLQPPWPLTQRRVVYLLQAGPLLNTPGVLI